MKDVPAVAFDYAGLDADARTVVKQRTTEIRDRMGRAAQNIIEVKRFVGGVYPCRIAYGDEPARGAWIVYWLIDPATWQPFYIGRTCQFINRMRAHCQVRDGGARRPWGTAILDRRKLSVTQQHGLIPVGYVVVASEEDADRLEHNLIREFGGQLLNTKTNKWEVRCV